MIIRPELQLFVEDMEKKLQRNDHKDGWHKLSPQWLINRIRQETSELERSLGSSPYIIIAEAADVANFAMMLADNVRKTL